MIDENQAQLVSICAAYLMHKNSLLSPLEALKQLEQELFPETMRPDDIQENLHLKILSDAKVGKELFTFLKAITKSRILNYVEDWLNMRALKFSYEEAFSIIKNNNEVYVLITAPRMVIVLKRLSAIMTKSQISLQDAITEVLDPVSLQHITRIAQADINLLLSKEAKIQLYMHARVNLIIGIDDYQGSRYEDVLLRDNSEFLVEHPEKIWFEVDRGLQGLGYTLGECNDYLRNSTNQTIHAVYQKVLMLKEIAPIMIDKLPTLLKTKPTVPKIPVTSTKGLNDVFLPQQSLATNSNPQLNFRINNNNLLPGVNNSTLLTMLSVGSFLLATAWYFRPTILTGPARLLINTSSKVLGFCHKTHDHDEPEAEVDISSENHNNSGTYSTQTIVNRKV